LVVGRVVINRALTTGRHKPANGIYQAGIED
jgi:hypothetical protein